MGWRFMHTQMIHAAEIGLLHSGQMDPPPLQFLHFENPKPPVSTGMLDLSNASPQEAQTTMIYFRHLGQYDLFSMILEL
jgi:hypothetical protein